MTAHAVDDEFINELSGKDWGLLVFTREPGQDKVQFSIVANSTPLYFMAEIAFEELMDRPDEWLADRIVQRLAEQN